MARLRIKNFGPVQQGLSDNSGWFEFRKVTVFTGNQGSGKSTVAKLLSTLSWIEKGLTKGQIKAHDLNIAKLIELLKYQRLDHYFKKTTEMEYEGDAFHIRCLAGVIHCERQPAINYHMPKIMYVSAERNLLSVMDRPDQLKNLPSPLFTFLEEYDVARNAYSQGISLPVGNVAFEYDLHTQISRIRGSDYLLRLSEASSGLQSSVPLFLVTKYLTESLGAEGDPSIRAQSVEEQRQLSAEVERILKDPSLSEAVRQESLRQLSSRHKPACLINIVEEPEQNLYPESQQQLLYELLKYNNMNQWNRLVLTTHSPYLINHLSIAVQGSNVEMHLAKNGESENLRKRLDLIVPLESQVGLDDIAIYEMDEKDGTARLLPTYEGIPSDQNYLNQSLRKGNLLFDQLLEIEEEA